MLTDTILQTTPASVHGAPRLRERRSPARAGDRSSFEPLRLSDARHAIARAVTNLDDRQALAELGLLEENGEVLGEVRVGLRQGYLHTTDLHAMILLRFETLLVPLQKNAPRHLIVQRGSFLRN